MILIPSATLLKPSPAFLAAFPMESIRLAMPFKTFSKPPLIASMTSAMALPMP